MATIAIEIDKDRLRDFCRKWKVTEFSLFGSVTRPEQFRDDSDVDVLVRFDEAARVSLFDISHMETELRELFGRHVDLAEREGIEQSPNAYRRDRILSSAVALEL